jgi:transcriptional regulator with XRE-family HTH domain/tetratricopeptide (TPR) repeat protein
MAREPEELVAMRRALGAQLAVFRQAAGLTQGQLAKAAFCDRSTVAHIEKGRSRGDERFWTVADECCGANGVLLAGFHAWVAAKHDHEVQIREEQLGQARAKAESLRATAAPQLLREAELTCMAGEVANDGGDQVTEQLVRLLCRLVGAMNRRELLQLLGWAGTVFASSAVRDLDAEEQERLARAIVSPSRVDERVIGHIDAMFRHCQRQEDALGSRAVLPTVLGQSNLVRDLLAECPDNLRSRLLSVYSDMSTSIGYYFFELNDTGSAKSYHEQARTAAHDAGSVELSIYALCEWSYTASWQGQASAGLDLAAAAQSLVGKTQDPLMSVGTAQRAATAYAFDGQYKEYMVEIEKARNGLASAGQLSPESPLYFYNEGYLASHESECLLRLGRPKEAVVSASAALASYDKSFVDGYAVCTLHLGNAHLQSVEIDEAARVVGDAAGLAVQTRSARLIKELHATRARMQPWQGTQAVSVLDDQLAACGLASGTVGV